MTEKLNGNFISQPEAGVISDVNACEIEAIGDAPYTMDVRICIASLDTFTVDNFDTLGAIIEYSIDTNPYTVNFNNPNTAGTYVIGVRIRDIVKEEGSVVKEDGIITQLESSAGYLKTSQPIVTTEIIVREVLVINSDEFVVEEGGE